MFKKNDIGKYQVTINVNKSMLLTAAQPPVLSTDVTLSGKLRFDGNLYMPELVIISVHAFQIFFFWRGGGGVY